MDINAGNKGLINLGNTCYMNSILQCLSHLLIFHPKNENFYEQCKNKNEKDLIYHWYQFQRKMWNNANINQESPVNLLRCFKTKCDENNLYFEGFHQNDVDEFLTLFLDLLHREIKKKVKINLKLKNKDDEASKLVVKGYETWKRFFENDYSYIVENFYSQLSSLTVCPECYYFTSNHDPIQVLSLELIDKTNLSIYDCLDNYTSKKVLDKQNLWTCDKCKNKVQPHQKTVLFKTSEILIILLKKYNIHRKIDKFINYPMILNLDKYNRNYGTDKPNKYKLEGFCIHQGSLNGGHYYAVCNNIFDKKWYEYNDSRVNNINCDSVLNYKPYLFFYKRI
jgi:ubiquitin carboxyl-terminal hydrolase 8